MPGPILRKLTFFVLFCNILNTQQDFLEYYQPRADFPKELNEWLAYVQGHKNDFRIIRNIVKRRKEESDYYDEKEYEVKQLNDIEEDLPQNEIYPHTGLSRNEKKFKSYGKQSKRRSNSSGRTRRESDQNAFFEFNNNNNNNNNIEIDPMSKKGEIKRSGPKYPHQFVNRDRENIDKREIQIDILNDGKLIKSIKENEKSPKSVVLNIENAEEKPMQSVDFNEVRPAVADPPVAPTYTSHRSIEIDNANNKEEAANYHNLFTVNENLNTDSSAAREALEKTALMYHVTLPEPNFLLPNNTYPNQNNFQRNNLNDMSKYWSASEKNQLQQGIEFAQETGNLRKMQQNIPQKLNDGFETARTLVVEHVANKQNNAELQSESHRNQNKRNLQALDGKIQIGDPIMSSINNQYLDITKKSNTQDLRQPALDQPPVYSDDPNPKNRLIFVTESRLDESYDENKNLPTRPQIIDETINNHIAINIVEPQRDEEPSEEIKQEPIVNIDEIVPPRKHDNVNEDIEGCSQSSCRTKEQTQSNNELKLTQIDTPSEVSNYTANGVKSHDEGKMKNQHNDIHIHMNPARQEEEQEIHQTREEPSDLIKLPLENKFENESENCVGPNCGSNKRFYGVKHKRKRGRRRHKFRRIYDDDSFNDYEFPSYQMRQLKSADYIYDSDLSGSDENYAEEEPISSERSKRLEMYNKHSLEGDYSDEEDSFGSKNNVSSKLLKISDNAFANPRTTTQTNDDDDYYYYENIEKPKNFNKGTNSKFDDTVSVGKRLHKKMKNPPKQNKELSNTQIREPRESEENLEQLPKYELNDNLDKENINKRSLTNQYEIQKNKFPLSSKSFFASNNPRRRESNDLDILVDKQPLVSNTTDKNSSVADNLVAADLLDESTIRGNSNGMSDVQSVATEECESTHVSIGPICATDNFTKIKVTTMLNLVADSQGDLNDTLPSLNEQYQNLEDILIGRLPLSIVDSVFKHMKTHPTFKQRFFKGMKQNHSPLSFRNLPEISGKESHNLIRLMSKIMNRLQWTTTCQVLPFKLKRYLKAITQVKIEDRLTKTKAMEEIDFDDTQNQTNFIFHSNNGVDNIEEKVRILKNMLNKYQHLPESCKPRAEPVKEYIENHLDMLTHVMSNNMEGPRPRKSDESEEQSGKTVQHETAKRNEEKEEDPDLIEQELESLGLGKHPNFRRKFDLDSLLHNSNSAKDQGRLEGKRQMSKKGKKRDISRETSDEYERLLEAVKKARIKREGNKRIAEAFGRLGLDEYNGKNSDNVIKEVFENPLVYSL